MFPVRCFSCGKVIGRLEKKYNEMLEQGYSIKETLNSLNLTRYCCRRMFLCHVPIVDKLLLFSKDIPMVNGKNIDTE